MKKRIWYVLSTLVFAGFGCRHYVVRDVQPVQLKVRNSERIALVGFKCYKVENRGNWISWFLDPGCDLKSEVGFGRPVSDIEVKGFDTTIEERSILDFLGWAEIIGEPNFIGERPRFLPEKELLFGRDAAGDWKLQKRDVDYYVVGKLTPYRTAFSEVGAVAYFASLIPHVVTAGLIPIVENHNVKVEVAVFDSKLNRVETLMKTDTYWTIVSWFSRPNGRRGTADDGFWVSGQVSTPPSNAWVASVVDVSNELAAFFAGSSVQ